MIGKRCPPFISLTLIAMVMRDKQVRRLCIASCSLAQPEYQLR